jgi:7-cyano-7-deazaguanine tRNA-ribosyltransferase
MTSTRTIRLEDLSELPCRCPVCMGHDLQGLLELPRAEREGLLARHNLYVTVEEIRTIKQSIREGSLWELLETRCRSHPKLYEGFKRLSIYSDYIEANDPVLGKKVRGLFIYDDNSIVRPEVVRHRQRISERYRRPKGRDILVLLPTPDEKPFNRSRIFREARKMLEGRRAVHICFYGGPFSIIPSELAETFPLSQYESSSGFGTGWRKDLLSFMKRNRYRKVVMLQDGGEVKIRGVRIVRSLDNILAEVS